METVLEFAGRASALEQIKAKWLLASNVEAPKPQIVLLTGETGVGKTRLAMEFYRWLDEEVDEAGPRSYWPDVTRVLDPESSALLSSSQPAMDQPFINPPPRLCNFKNDIPYLWWGLHVRRDDIARFDSYLAPHMAQLLINTVRRQRIISYGGLFAKFTADLLSGGLTSLTYDVLTKSIDDWGVIRKDSAVEDALNEGRARTDRILAHMEAVFSSNEGTLTNPSSLLNSYSKVPAVILIDDAQNWPESEAFPRFVENLFYKCVSQKWPVLILVTHWQRELAPEVTPQEYSFAGILRHCRHGKPDENGPAASVPGGFLTDAHFTEIPLKKIDDLSRPLEQQLPGLTTEQSRRLLVEADGNPRLLEQIILYAKEHEGLFEDLDPNNPLTEGGFTSILSNTDRHDHYKIVRARLRDAPQSVQEAIGLASLQGFEFLEDFVEAVGQAHLKREVRSDLRRADETYRWVELQRGQGAPGVGQFAERVFQQVAEDLRKHHKSFQPEAELQITFCETIKALAIDLIATADLGDATRQPMLLLAFDITARIFSESDDPRERLLAQSVLSSLSRIHWRRSSIEEFTATYERLLAIKEPENQIKFRAELLDALSSAYRNFNWPSKRTMAIKRRIYEGYRIIGDQHILAFSSTEDRVREYYEQHKSRVFETIPSALEPTKEENAKKLESWAHNNFSDAIRILSPALLELSEVARTWRGAPPNEGDDPMGSAPFLLRIGESRDGELGLDVEPEISDMLRIFGYNLGSFIDEDFSRIEHFDILNREGQYLSSAGRLEAAVDAMERALSIAQDLGDGLLQIQVLSNWGLVHGENGDLEKSKDRLLEAAKIIRELDSEPTFDVAEIADGDTIHYKLSDDVLPDEEPLVRQRISMIGGLRSVYDADPREAAGQMRKLIQMCGNVEANLGTNALEGGDYEVAEKRFENAMPSYLSINDGERIAQTLTNLALTANRQNELEKACKYWKESISVYGQLKEHDAGDLNEIRWDAAITRLQQDMEDAGCA